MRCSRHKTLNCIRLVCKRERDRRQSNAAADLGDPGSATFEATYGGYDYGSSSSSCDTSSSSSSSSSDSGSSSSCD